MNRRQALAAALLGTFGLAGCRRRPPAAEPAPAAPPPAAAVAWTLVTAWPRDYPGLDAAARDFARRVALMSGGRLSIEVFAADERVPALAVFDAVSRGKAQLGHGAAHYWAERTPAAPFFAAIPFGLAADESLAWLRHGGGQALWDEAYAPFGVKPLPAGNGGAQLGGWFNREIRSLQDFEGLRVHMPGLGGEVLKRFAAIPQTLAVQAVPAALYDGSIDAAAGGSPSDDLAGGLAQLARFCYYPGWQAPQSPLELLVNRKAWDGLPADLQAIVEEAARGSGQLLLDAYTAANAQAVEELRRQGVELRRLPDELLAALHHESEQVLELQASRNELNGRIWASLKAFRGPAGELRRLTAGSLAHWR